MVQFRYVEDFVPPALADFIEQTIDQTDSWSWTSQTVSADAKRDDKNDNILDGPQLVRYLFHPDMNGPCHQMFDTVANPLMWFFADRLGTCITELDRVKVNLLFPILGGSNKTYNSPHVDTPTQGAISMVYYISESDGDTFIFDKSVIDSPTDMEVVHRQSPKKGSALIFPSTIYHSSQNPVNYPDRKIINFCMKVDNPSVLW